MIPSSQPSHSPKNRCAHSTPCNGCKTGKYRLLTIDHGPSSLRFSVYEVGRDDTRVLLSGKLDRLGTGQSRLEVVDGAGSRLARHLVAVADHKAALVLLMERLPSFGAGFIDAMAHRIFLNEARRNHPELVTPALIQELKAVCPPHPPHLPASVEALEIARKLAGNIPQVACLDTTLHRNLAAVVQLAFPTQSCCTADR